MKTALNETTKAGDVQSEERKPYRLKEKAIKDASYRKLIKPELADELYDRILMVMVGEKKYRDASYSAQKLAKDLGTNPRYLSAVMNSRFGDNYATLVNEYRVRDAQHMLTDKRYKNCTMEEIGAMAGFSNRQSFYSAFFKFKGVSPRKFREKFS